MRVVFLGPPGAGKGTQTKFLEARYGVCLISTGEMLRQAVQDGTPLGDKARAYIEKGELVPDDLMVGLMARRLREKDCGKGFILDGFPRTLAQAEGLERALQGMGWKLDGVLFLDVPRRVAVERLSHRRTCRVCGGLYHLVSDPPQREGVCDRCGGELYQRDDDKEETIAARLRVYEEQTLPVVDYYRRKGLLDRIDGTGNVEEIRARILEALERRGAVEAF